jgi:alkanesulfonate monooxygenase SsuD/methylene tetrahydromethanopterin reductase-like flavin-dependent oxidoreductase (luciferase family)
MASLGVIFHPTFPPQRLVDYAQRAEAGGFDELWLWEDSFWAGAYTSAATILARTESIKVGIGLSPATVRNPLFAAMEITTLAVLHPGRFMPGFGHGVEGWMRQIGAAPKSSLRALGETVEAVRRLLLGETVTVHGDYVHLEDVKMLVTPDIVPPLYVGGMREKTLQLAGRVGDGTILTEMSSPAYVRWAQAQVEIGRQGGGRAENRLAVFAHAKVSPDGASARKLMRGVIAQRLGWAGVLLEPLGIAEEAQALLEQYGIEGATDRMPEAWLDALSVSGTPDQAAAAITRLAEAGAGSVILQPQDGSPDCLDEYIRFLGPSLK